MTELEFQDEEREALLSIYEGDAAFKQLSATIFQYKFGEPDSFKSILLELQWGEKYPSEKPDINMETFYNRHINQALKNKLKDMVLEEAEQYLGMSMTYSLFEFVREKFEKLIEEFVEEDTIINDEVKELTIGDGEQSDDIKKKTQKKEQLTKAQKRRQWDRVGDKGERPRGWDWVDIVKHLSQTGSKEDQVSASTS